MNIDPTFLRAFIGGIWLFRFPCFEVGPDFYYLFKSKIVDIDLDQSGLWVDLKDVYPNRFESGSWIKHPTQEVIQHFKVGQDRIKGKEIILPLFKAWSPKIIHAKLDCVAEAVIYADQADVPDELYIFKHFDKGYEGFAGLGGIF